jgi:hypothetical protein
MDLGKLSRKRLTEMLRAGEDILECYRVLAKTGANTTGEILRGAHGGDGEFVEWDHYPAVDVFDQETHSQYYYHAHRGAWNEHGHFHVFVRHGGMPSGVRPVLNDGAEEWPSGTDAICHLIAISMDEYGFPQRLFTTNRWVTGETWYAAADATAMLDRFLIDHTWPSWATNRWISGMVRLFRPRIADLLVARDQAVARWRESHPDGDPFEDRDLEVTSALDISVDDQIAAVRRARA